MGALGPTATPWSWMTMIVMSSVRVSNCSQRRYDSATHAIAASSGSSNLDTRSTTACDERNSNTPSEAMMMCLVSELMSVVRISGSA